MKQIYAILIFLIVATILSAQTSSRDSRSWQILTIGEKEAYVVGYLDSNPIDTSLTPQQIVGLIDVYYMDPENEFMSVRCVLSGINNNN